MAASAELLMPRGEKKNREDGGLALLLANIPAEQPKGERFSDQVKCRPSFAKKLGDLANYASMIKGRKVAQGEIVEAKLALWVAAAHAFIQTQKFGDAQPNLTEDHAGDESSD